LRGGAGCGAGFKQPATRPAECGAG